MCAADHAIPPLTIHLFGPFEARANGAPLPRPPRGAPGTRMVQWLLAPSTKVKVTGKSGISQARARLGWEPLRQLHDDVVRPIAVAATRGAWYRGWRLVSIDGGRIRDCIQYLHDQPAFDEFWS